MVSLLSARTLYELIRSDDSAVRQKGELLLTLQERYKLLTKQRDTLQQEIEIVAAQIETQHTLTKTIQEQERAQTNATDE